MSSYRFSTGKLFKWNDNLFRVKRTLQNNQLVVEEIASAETRLLYRDELVKALFRNELFFVDADNYQEIKPTYLIDLSDYSPYQIEVANHRLKIIQPHL